MPESGPATKPQPVLIIMSTLAGLQVLTGGAALGDIIGVKLAGLFILIVAAIQTAMGFYLKGQVVPLVDTAAYLNEDRELIAGPAAQAQDGTSVTVQASTDL